MTARKGRVALLLATTFVLLAGAQLSAAGPGASSDTSGPKGSPGNPNGVVTRGTDADCTEVDFEGVGNLSPIGVVSGVPEVTFGDAWLGLIDSDAGGTGNIANEPSPSTGAFFLEPAEPIDFDTGVQYVEFQYSAAGVSLPMTLSAWDGPGGTGNLVDSTVGNTVGTDYDGANCNGDPNGDFCGWTQLTLSASDNTIRSVTLSGGAANYVVFDDMRYCTSIPPDAPAMPASAMALLAGLLVVGGALVARRFV